MDSQSFSINKQTSYNIQVLRGAAIIAVVLIHSIPTRGFRQVLYRPFLNFGVALFLFLSGMLSSADRYEPAKRIIKVTIPYVIWTIIYVVLRDYRNITVIPASVLVSLVTARAAAPFYYVFVYCELTLLIPLIDRLAKSRFKYWGLLISPCEIILFRLLPILRGWEFDPVFYTVQNVSCFGWLIYFYLGYLLGNGLIDMKIPQKKLYLFLVVSLFIQFAEGYWYLRMGQINCGTQLKLSAILTGIIICLLAYRFVLNNHSKMDILKVIGDNSFGIFISHLAVMFFLEKIPFYTECIVIPVKVFIPVAADMALITIGKKLLGKYSGWIAF